MYVSKINIFPIKSLKGISVDSAMLEARGLQHDRRWMLTDLDGRFMTQREFPRMALICVEVLSDGLLVRTGGQGEMKIAFEPRTGDIRPMTIWQSICDGEVYRGAVNEWFSDALDTKCQLAHMPDDTRRSINPRFDHGWDIVSFADGYPLMVLGEATLADLNERIADANGGEPLPMNRFRPNLVIAGSGAFAEDDWSRIRIGGAEFRSTKPCERCVITTIEQSTGEFTGKEPLRALASYRMAKTVMPDRYESLGIAENAVLFGQNLIGETQEVTIRSGDEIDVLEYIGSYSAANNSRPVSIR